MVKTQTHLSRFTKPAFENAIRACAAIGGSTNAVIHLIALARRIGVDLTLDDWDRVGREVHCLVNLMPSGKYLMEDFYYAGGLPAVLRELGENALLHKDALTVNGKTIWENSRDAPCHNRDVIFPFKQPFKENTGIAVLRGNLSPEGAIIKPSAATPRLMKHRGRAVVFEKSDFTAAGPRGHRRETSHIQKNQVLKNCGRKAILHGRGRQMQCAKLRKKGGPHAEHLDAA